MLIKSYNNKRLQNYHKIFAKVKMNFLAGFIGWINHVLKVTPEVLFNTSKIQKGSCKIFISTSEVLKNTSEVLTENSETGN